MKFSARTGVRVVILLVVTAPIAWCYLPWRLWRYNGPGEISDSGVISYPRFHIRFPAIPLHSDKTSSFTFSGAPATRMSLQLYVLGAGGNEAEVLENLDVKIRASIIQEPTNRTTRVETCTASGTPNSKRESERWVLMSGRDVAAFWHQDCIDQPFNPSNRYTLTIATQPSGSNMPQFTLAPTLEGGGIELP